MAHTNCFATFTQCLLTQTSEARKSPQHGECSEALLGCSSRELDTSEWQLITSSSPFGTTSGQGTRQAKASIRDCYHSSRCLNKRSKQWESYSGRWSNWKLTTLLQERPSR